MELLRNTARIVITASYLLAAYVANSTDESRVLYLDGKLRAQGVPLDGTRVVIDRDGLQVNVINGDVTRIGFGLDLGHTYLLSFEQKGCMTKQLFFDTNVPEEALAFAPFIFRFKVTLEERELDAAFHYAQPVGYIRYYPDKMYFDYDVNYALYRDRMAKSATRHTSNALLDEPMDPDNEGVKGLGGSNDHLLESNTKDQPEPSRNGEVPRPQRTGRPIRPNRELSTTNESLGTQVHPLPDGRTELLIVEPTYVARVVRITQKGRTTEYSRVVHRYGDTHYFLNGNSCGEATYGAGIRADR